MGVRLGDTARARHAAGGIHHNPRGVDQAGSDQWGQGQGRSGRVAAGGGNQGRAGKLLAEQLGDPGRGVGEQRRAAVFGPIPFGVEARVPQPEVRGQVDHGPYPFEQVGYQLLRRPVGQSQEDHVEPVSGRGVGVDEDQIRVARGEARIEVLYPAAGLAVRGGHYHLERRVAGGQPHQLGAGVSRRPKDPDLERAGHGTYYTSRCIVMREGRPPIWDRPLAGSRPPAGGLSVRMPDWASRGTDLGAGVVRGREVCPLRIAPKPPSEAGRRYDRRRILAIRSVR